MFPPFLQFAQFAMISFPFPLVSLLGSHWWVSILSQYPSFNLRAKKCWLLVLQSEVESGRSVYQIPCRAAMNSVEWNPKYNLLAFAADDKNKYQADEGMSQSLSFLVGSFSFVRGYWSLMET